MPADPRKLSGANRAIERSSHRVYCDPLQAPAVISVVSRSGPRRSMRYVLWCSLRAADACCEDCLAQVPRPAGAAGQRR